MRGREREGEKKRGGEEGREKRERDGDGCDSVITSCRRKLTNKLKEAEEAHSGLQVKHSSLEKTKKRISDELEDLNLDLEKVDRFTQLVTYHVQLLLYT